MRNSPGTDIFALSARTATFNKLLGLSVAAAYRDPAIIPSKNKDKVKSVVTPPNPSKFVG